MKQCSSGEFDNWQTSFTVQNRQYDLSLVQMHGLKMEICVNAYTPQTIASDIAGVWESEFLQTLEYLDGHAPLYLEMDVQGIKYTNEQLEEGRVAIHDQDDEVCFLLVVEFDDPDIDSDFQMAILYSDEFGGTQWLLQSGTFRDGSRRHCEFFVPRPAGIETNRQAGRFGNPGKRMLRLVGWKNDFSEEYFEQKLTRLGDYDLFHVRRQAESDWYFESLMNMSDDDRKKRWNEFDRKHGKSLLLIHGTNGTSSGAFGDLLKDEPVMEELRQKYGERILAFNHRSVRHGILKNVKRLIKYLNTGSHIELDLDILTRSRGALVARQLVEQEEAHFPKHLKITPENKLVMLFGPNQGTPAAQGRHLLRTDKVNSILKQLRKQLRMTLDDNDRLDLLHEIARVRGKLQGDKGPILKILARGAEDQTPNSSFLKALNGPDATPRPETDLPTYYLVGVEFDPHHQEIPISKEQRKKLVKALKKIFGEHPHDGIIPAKSARMQMDGYDRSPNFYLKDEHTKILTQAVNTNHINYPTDRNIRNAIKHFLLDDSNGKPKT